MNNLKLANLVGGIVTHKTKGFYFVSNPPNPVVACTAKGRWFKDSHFSQQIVVGDVVEYQLNGEQGLITAVSPRRNTFSRLSVRADAEQILAANLDHLAILAAAHLPVWQDNWVLRLLLAANLGRVKPWLVISKTDLVEPAYIEKLKQPYQRIGIPIFEYNLRDAASLEKLKKAFAHQTVALVGRSGVGKTSLLNYFCPDLGFKTGPMHEKSLTGTHTTSLARMIDTSFNCRLIDTPGLKKYGFWRLTTKLLAQSFPGFAPHLKGCKYKNCIHLNEPGCQIIQAVTAGKLPARIYEGYLSIQASLV